MKVICPTEVPGRMPHAVIALGANEGDRLAAFLRAGRMLAARGAHLARRSRLYWTRPLGGGGGARYLNALVVVETRLPPLALLAACQEVERAMGRRRRIDGRPAAGADPAAPRALDLDLIFHADFHLDGLRLKLPHARWAERDFVILGLMDIGYAPPGELKSGARRRLKERLAKCERCAETAWETARWRNR